MEADCTGGRLYPLLRAAFRNTAPAISRTELSWPMPIKDQCPDKL